jgi:hypothetical protein
MTDRPGLPILLVLIVLGMPSAAPAQSPFRSSAQDGRPLLSLLGPDDTVAVDYRSQGCFHFDAYRLVLRGGKGLRVTVYEDVIQELQQVALGSLTLDREEVESLDNAIAFYRSGPPEGCTTVESFRLVWKRGGELRLEESLTDGSCGAGDRHDSMLTIAELLDRALATGFEEPEGAHEGIEEPAGLADHRARGPFDLTRDLGLVGVDSDGGLCLAIADPQLPVGQSLTLVSPRRQEIETLRVIERLEKPCWAGVFARMILGEHGDSHYRLTPPAREPFADDAYMGVLLPESDFTVSQDRVRVDLDGKAPGESFRVCTSNEGLHLTIWSGAPLEGVRLWHRYLYLGFEIEPGEWSCRPPDYEDPDPPPPGLGS